MWYVDFRDANLTDVNFLAAQMHYSQLEGAAVDGAYFREANLTGTVLENSDVDPDKGK